MKNLKFLVALLLLAAGCGPSTGKPPGGGSGPSHNTPRQDEPGLSPDELDRLEKRGQCVQNPTADVTPYKCACLLKGDNTDDCKCAKDENAELAGGGNCTCLEEAHRNDIACACYLEPNGKECRCKNDPSLSECQGEVYSQDQLCNKLRSKQYTDEELKLVADANRPRNLQEREKKIAQLPSELQRLSKTDCDNDQLTTGEELVLPTESAPYNPADTFSDPLLSDTDGDGLKDSREKQLKTSPRKADSDDDGLNDKQELDIGFDPADPYSNQGYTGTTKQPVLDGDAWQVNICNELAAKSDERNRGRVLKNEKFDLQIVLPTSIALDESNTGICNKDIDKNPQGSGATQYYVIKEGITNSSGKRIGGLVRYADSSGVAGATFTMPRSSASDVGSIRDSILTKLNSSGLTINYVFSGNEFTTHDGFAASTIEAEVQKTGATTGMSLLDDLIKKISKGQIEANGLDLSKYSNFFIRITIIYRGSKLDPVILLGAVERDLYKAEDSQAAMRLADLTNTTNTARFNDAIAFQCSLFKTQAVLPNVYFYFVLDESGSVKPANRIMRQGVTGFVDKINKASINYKIGISNIIPRIKQDSLNRYWPMVMPAKASDEFANTNRNYANGVILSPWTENGSQVIKAVQRILDANGGDERGLAMAYSGIMSMLDLPPNDSRAISRGSTVITTWITDEDDDSQDVSAASFLGSGTCKAAMMRELPKLTTGFSICSTSGNGVGKCSGTFKEIAIATGGAYGDLQHTAINELTQKIVDKATSLVSKNTLSSTPISSSITLYKGTIEESNDPSKPEPAILDHKPKILNEKEIIYRGRDNGFDYEPSNRTISFYGDSKPKVYRQQGLKAVVSQHVAVAFRYFLIRSKAAD